MKLKYNKLCSFDMDIAERLDSEPNRKASLVISEAVEAHYGNRIIPANCKVKSLDVTDWIIDEIKKSVQMDKTDYSCKTSSFVILKRDTIIDQVVFSLLSEEIEIDIKFNVIIENEIEIQFIRWVYDTRYKYEIDFDDSRLKEIEESVIFKL